MVYTLEPSAQIELLRRQFYQLLEPNQLHIPPKDVLKTAASQATIYDTMFRDNCVSCPPPNQYKCRVLKLLVEQIELAITDPEEDEISDALMACLAALMCQPSLPASITVQQKSYVTYTRAIGFGLPRSSTDAHSITLLESRAVLASSGTTGLRTWEAALRLATFLASEEGTKFVKAKNILELGAGTGFVSILCAKQLKAAYVLATDGSADVVDALSSNIYLNGLEDSGTIEPALLKWGHDPIKKIINGDECDRRFDLVLGADVTYDHTSMPLLVSTMTQIFEQSPTAKMLISATIRNAATVEIFLAICHAHSLVVKALYSDWNHPDRCQLGFFHSTTVEIRLFLVTRCQMESPLKSPSMVA